MKAIIFDMDGVLILTEKMHHEVYGKVCKQHGYVLSHEDYNKYFAGKRTIEAFEGFLKSKGEDISLGPTMVKEFRAIKRDILLNKLEQFVILRKGTYDMLARLKSDYKLAIATSTIKEFTDIIIDGLNLRRYFDIIVTAENVSKGKPDPQVYLVTAKKLKAEIKDCIVLEDAENGIESAKNAKMLCIAIKDKSLGKRNLSKADYTIEDFKELTPELIENLFPF